MLHVEIALRTGVVRATRVCLGRSRLDHLQRAKLVPVKTRVASLTGSDVRLRSLHPEQRLRGTAAWADRTRQEGCSSWRQHSRGIAGASGACVGKHTRVAAGPSRGSINMSYQVPTRKCQAKMQFSVYNLYVTN